MTKEQAIEVLRCNTNLGYGIVIENESTQLIKEAIDMAVKALEQNTVPQETYDSEYLARKQAEYELWKIKEQQPSDDTWSIKDVTNALTRHGLLEQGPSEKEKELNRLKAELQRAKMDAQTSYIQSPMPTSMIDKSNFNIEQYKSDGPPVTPTRKVGKWIYHFERDDYNDYENEYYECPFCHDLGGDKYYHYCPVCGNKVKGVEDGSN